MGRCVFGKFIHIKWRKMLMNNTVYFRLFIKVYRKFLEVDSFDILMKQIIIIIFFMKTPPLLNVYESMQRLMTKYKLI